MMRDKDLSQGEGVLIEAQHLGNPALVHHKRSGKTALEEAKTRYE